MQTTRWLDRESNRFDEIINRILAFRENEDIETGEKNFKIDKVFPENKTITLNSRELTFNKLNVSYDIVDAGEQPEEDRTTKREDFLIVYTTGINVNYIINKNTAASTLIRKLNGYTGKNQLKKNMIELDSDFFIWLISKVYNRENSIEVSENTDIQINSIKGLKGNTDDLLNKVTADGKTIMNVISTLSFLLESNNISQIKTDIEYKEHQHISLTLNKTSTIDTDLKDYTGILLGKEKELAFSELLLTIYIELIPNLFRVYQQEKREEAWGAQKYIEFIEKVGKDVSERIKEKVKSYKE
ncbi:hypothetical protein [uncultured Fusobacterium sp.]|uniref:hypothetical protein n=1 Tax=uncultured Fusobacterium sp. TaxID=159267 RepID=UPI0025CE4A66|nr:hypothetical protein [uncultured Fusobacterium sp.]